VTFNITSLTPPPLSDTPPRFSQSFSVADPPATHPPHSPPLLSPPAFPLSAIFQSMAMKTFFPKKSKDSAVSPKFFKSFFPTTIFSRGFLFVDSSWGCKLSLCKSCFLQLFFRHEISSVEVFPRSAHFFRSFSLFSRARTLRHRSRSETFVISPFFLGQPLSQRPLLLAAPIPPELPAHLSFASTLPRTTLTSPPPPQKWFVHSNIQILSYHPNFGTASSMNSFPT